MEVGELLFPLLRLVSIKSSKGFFLELEVGLGSKMVWLDCLNGLGEAKFLQPLVEFV